jgi:hypothetical protein
LTLGQSAEGPLGMVSCLTRQSRVESGNSHTTSLGTQSRRRSIRTLTPILACRSVTSDPSDPAICGRDAFNHLMQRRNGALRDGVFVAHHVRVADAQVLQVGVQALGLADDLGADLVPDARVR